MAEQLKRRIADLQAATSMTDLVTSTIVKVPGSKNILVKLSDEHSISVIANHKSAPVSDDGTVDWSSVTRIKIMEIEKYGC